MRRETEVAMNEPRKAHAAMVVSTLLVATSFPAVSMVAGALHSAVLTTLRFALAALLFLPWIAARHPGGLRPDRRAILRYAILSAPLVGFFVAMFEALRTTTPLNTAAIFTLVPSFVAVFAFFLLRERVDARRGIALSLGTVGALWVVSRGEPSRLLALDFAVGDAWFLAGTASLGLYAVLVKRLHRGEPQAVMTFWTLVTGALWLTAFAGHRTFEVAWTEVPPRVFAVTACLAAFTTLATFFLTQYAATVVGPTRTMAYTFWNPALVAVLAWAIDGARVDAAAWPGVALTVLATVAMRDATPRTVPNAARGASARA